VLVGRGIPKICLQGNDASTEKLESENAGVAIISQLCTHLHDVTDNDCATRLVLKFTENEYEKLERCIELFGMYYNSLQDTDRKIQATIRAFETNDDDEELELYSASIPELVRVQWCHDLKCCC
jgi:hypothetical protein